MAIRLREVLGGAQPPRARAMARKRKATEAERRAPKPPTTQCGPCTQCPFCSDRPFAVFPRFDASPSAVASNDVLVHGFDQVRRLTVNSTGLFGRTERVCGLQ
jgi:hypothetical protein